MSSTPVVCLIAVCKVISYSFWVVHEDYILPACD